MAIGAAVSLDGFVACVGASSAGAAGALAANAACVGTPLCTASNNDEMMTVKEVAVRLKVGWTDALFMLA